MNEDEIRALVRTALARQLGLDAPEARIPAVKHPSHLRLPVEAGSERDGACLIEPAVSCNHCGYCQSFGH
jgi:hypothetical protein